MIVLVIHVDRVLTIEPKRDPPVTAHPNGPSASPFTLELMQVKPGRFISGADREA
jgi:hypothetical protein